MKILINAWGSLGDVYPFLALGLALQARGNTVTMLSTGNFEELVRRTGLDFHAIASAEDYAAALRNPDIWNGVSADDLIDKYVEITADPTCRYIEKQKESYPTLVIAATRGIRMREILQSTNVPVIAAYLTPEIFYADKSSSKIGLFPDWFAGVAPDDPDASLMTGFSVYISDEDKCIAETWRHLEEFLAEGEPPIVFTPGTAMAHGKFFFEAALEACQSLGRRALFLSPYLQQIPPDLPPTIKHFNYLPLWRLLPYTSALVYHGGIGTCAQALHSGVPQLVMPLAYDQFANANRVKRFGVGDFLDPRAFTADILRDKLRDLTASDSIRVSCRKLAAKFDNGDVMNKTCDLIATMSNARIGVS